MHVKTATFSYGTDTRLQPRRLLPQTFTNGNHKARSSDRRQTRRIFHSLSRHSPRLDLQVLREGRQAVHPSPMTTTTTTFRGNQVPRMLRNAHSCDKPPAVLWSALLILAARLKGWQLQGFAQGFPANSLTDHGYSTP